MSDAQTAFAVRAAARLLPSDVRECVIADLTEESTSLAANRGTSWVTGQVLHIAACYHVACYRHCHELWRVGCLFAAVLALLLVMPHAAAQVAAGAKVFSDPVSRAAMTMLSAGHLVSAAAAGALIGRVAFLAAARSVVRWHLTLVALALAVARDGWPAALPAIALLVSCVWLGDANRRTV